MPRASFIAIRPDLSAKLRSMPDTVLIVTIDARINGQSKIFCIALEKVVCMVTGKMHTLSTRKLGADGTTASVGNEGKWI